MRAGMWIYPHKVRYSSCRVAFLLVLAMKIRFRAIDIVFVFFTSLWLWMACLTSATTVGVG